MQGWLKVVEHIDDFNTRVGKLVAWLQLPIMAIIMFDVVFRRFLDVGSVMLQELEWHLHTILFLFAAAYAYQSDVHVRIDIIRHRLSERARAWIELIGCFLFLIPYTAIVLWLSIGFVERSWGLGEVSDAPGGLPYRWLIKSSMPLAFSILFLQAWSVALRKIIQLLNRQSR
ncbi:MAG: TRAP transporter small permease subunit [Candidatus Binatia bacterium]